MNKETNPFITPERKNNLTKITFALLCFILSVVCAIVVSTIIVPNIENTVCGFVPVELVVVCCAIGQLVGTNTYVKNISICVVIIMNGIR